jgi:hypothetical protein
VRGACAVDASGAGRRGVVQRVRRRVALCCNSALRCALARGFPDQRDRSVAIMSDNLNEQSIRERAYQLWELDGAPEGRADEYWDKARRQVLAEGTGQPDEAGISADQSSKRRLEDEVPQDVDDASASAPRAKRAR